MLRRSVVCPLGVWKYCVYPHGEAVSCMGVWCYYERVGRMVLGLSVVYSVECVVYSATYGAYSVVYIVFVVIHVGYGVLYVVYDVLCMVLPYVVLP